MFHPRKNKKYQQKYRDIHRQEIRDRNSLWKKQHRKQINESQQIYRLKHPIKTKRYEHNRKKTEKFKLWDKQFKAKRKRNLGFNLLYENILIEKVEYHHINNIDVGAIPKDLHQLYSGRNLELHRFMCNEIIKQIYRDD